MHTYYIIMHTIVQFDIPNYTVYCQIAIYFMYQIVKVTVLYKIYKLDKFDTHYTAIPS